MSVKPLFFSMLVLSLALSCHSARHKSAPKKAKPKKQTTKVDPAPVKYNAEKEVVWFDADAFTPVLEAAKKQKKLIFVEFYASWCAPCKVMEEDVFTQKPTFAYLNNNFINYRVDFDSPTGSKLAAIFEVKTLPTVLFVNDNAVVLTRHTGIAGHSVLVEKGDAAKKM